jgi:hypothetical protein
MSLFWYMGFIGFAILLAGCSSQRAAERAALTSNVTDCLVRETQTIAPQPIDLDTATSVVLARCDYPGVLERSLVTQYPGHSEYVHETMQKQYPAIVDMVRGGIAKLRTQ